MSIIIQLFCSIGIIRAVESYYPMPEPLCHQNCPASVEGDLNVHLVPHTHLDVGWLKTMDEYYSDPVKNILNTVVKNLWGDPDKRFVLAETAFFWRWWGDQPVDVKHKVHALVQSGRLQFVNGAWTMNDEATTHYQSIIDQFTWGLSKLNRTFGECGLPLVAWQIDPFGHSREFASLLAAMGYEGLFLGRIDYEDKNNRIAHGSMEMLWRGDDDIGYPSDIFTSILFNMYFPPYEFNFGTGMTEAISDKNAEVKVMIFLDLMREKLLDAYSTNNLLIPVGGDFNYHNDAQAAVWFDNLDKLIKYTNEFSDKYGQNIRLFYSTPDCYLRSVKYEKPVLPIKQDDFFPYSDQAKSYWTGYYTSRPTLKYLERLGNSYLQTVKQLQVLTGLAEKNLLVLDKLRSAMGVLQHHDAITGTAKQYVTRDYENMLNEAIDNSLVIVREAFNKLIRGDPTAFPKFSYERCPLHEFSCGVSENNEQFVVTVYNPLARSIEEVVRIPVPNGAYEVYVTHGDQIIAQTVELAPAILQIPTRNSKATQELVFVAFLAPMSFKSYYIRKSTVRIVRHVEEIIQEQKKYYNSYRNKMDNSHENITIWNPNSVSEDVIHKTANVNMNKGPVKANNIDLYDDEEDDDDEVGIPVEVFDIKKVVSKKRKDVVTRSKNKIPSEDDYYHAMFLGNEHFKIGLDKFGISYVLLPNGNRVKLNIKFYYYTSSRGGPRPSGAYIFLPDNNEMLHECLCNVTKGPTGPVIKEIQITNNDDIFAAVRVYNDLKFIEIDWVVGPINAGREYIVRYITDIENKGEFYTDSNGRQMLKRRINERPQWNASLTDNVAGNYYPVTNQIYIEDYNKRMVVLTDRSEGGTSLTDGQIELMLHRRLQYDDRLGVDEVLNEVVKNKGLIVRGRHRILILDADNKEDSIEEKKQVLQFHLQPQIYISSAQEVGLEQWMKQPNTHSFANDLPEGIHVLTVEPWFDGKMLLRIENYLDKGDAFDSIDVDLTAIFKTMKIIKFKETTLSAHVWQKDYYKWSWVTKTEFSESFNEDYGNKYKYRPAKPVKKLNDKGFVVKLRAKQIRTFVVQYELWFI